MERDFWFTIDGPAEGADVDPEIMAMLGERMGRILVKAEDGLTIAVDNVETVGDELEPGRFHVEGRGTVEYV